MHKEGTFNVDQSTPHQCISVGHNEYAYTARIRCDASKAQPDTGWITDVKELDPFLNSYFASNAAPSCEKMAIAVCHLLAAKVLLDGAEPHSVDVTVVGAAGGRMTCHMDETETAQACRKVKRSASVFRRLCAHWFRSEEPRTIAFSPPV